MKVQNPIIGRARGSAGGMTFCKNYDKNVARAKAFEVSNPNTQAQQTQRAFFAALTALIMDFSDEQLRTLFPNKPKTMSRRNALSKQIGKWNQVDGTEKTIDFAEISTLGNAPGMDMGETNCESDGSAFVVTLDNSVKQNQSLGDYHFIVAMVNETQKQISLTLSSAAVSTGTLTPAIPTTWALGDTVHAIPLITDQKASVSAKGFGSFIIKTRPEKAGN